MPPSDIRQYAVQARSTELFGRVLCSARTHHFIVDGPVQNGCPGEELTPVELFLASIAACGVELIQVLARAQSLPIPSVAVELAGELDRSKPVRQDYTVLNSLRCDFQLGNVTHEQGQELVAAFQKR